jgi:hypothetical protein
VLSCLVKLLAVVFYFSALQCGLSFAIMTRPNWLYAVYDRSPAMAVLEYVFEATKFVSGHRQGSRAVE